MMTFSVRYGSRLEALAAAARFGWYFGMVLPAKGAWWLTKNSTQGAWWLTKNFAGNTWYVTKNAAIYAWQGTVWTVTAPFKLLRWLFIEPMPEFENPRQAQAYKLVRRYYRRRRWLMTHAFIYSGLLAVGMLQIFSLLRIQAETGLNMFYPISSAAAFIAFFTMLLLFHFVRARTSNAEDEALANVLERDYGQSARSQSRREDFDYRGRLEDGYEAYPDEEAVAYYETEPYQKSKR